MKTTSQICSALLFTAALLPAAAHAEEAVTNRLTASLRFGLNISGRFTTSAALPIPVNGRLAPDGTVYNYDDGFVHTDISGNFGGQTWNFGYDNTAVQQVGNTLEMHRAARIGGGYQGNDAEPSPGLELTYNRPLGKLNDDRWRWGVEGAVNFLSISIRDLATYARPLTRTTDALPYTPGTTPPLATPGTPYQGSFVGPGFLLGDTPTSSTSTTVPGGALVGGRREFDGKLLGFRVGPYLDIPLSDEVNLYASAGFACGFLYSDLTYQETITVPGLGSVNASGRGSDTKFLYGAYAGATAVYQFAEDWHLSAGVQWQTLGHYRHNFGARGIELDLTKSIMVSLGLGYSF